MYRLTSGLRAGRDDPRRSGLDRQRRTDEPDRADIDLDAALRRRGEDRGEDAFDRFAALRRVLILVDELAFGANRWAIALASREL